jgi:hypothetical protein
MIACLGLLPILSATIAARLPTREPTTTPRPPLIPDPNSLLPLSVLPTPFGNHVHVVIEKSPYFGNIDFVVGKSKVSRMTISDGAINLEVLSVDWKRRHRKNILSRRCEKEIPSDRQTN